MPGAPVGRVGRDPGRQVRRLSAVEQHVRGQPLRQRARPALEREHRQHHRQQRRHERRAVYPRLDHAASTYNSRRLSGCHAPRILLVDDELSVQKLLTYPLRKEGYDVVPALDGREALERLRDDNFDLVVLDVMLPRMDGFDVCRAIRSRSTVPIIMLTAKTEETDKVLGLELGADDYITKPFSVREFRSRVKAVLRRAALAQPEDQFEEPIDAGRARRSTSRSAPVDRARRAGAPHLRGVRDPRGARARARAGVQPDDAARARVGRRRPTATRARSTSTSATCARSSRRSRRRPS